MTLLKEGQMGDVVFVMRLWGLDLSFFFFYTEGHFLEKYTRGGLTAICSDLKAQSAFKKKKKRL